MRASLLLFLSPLLLHPPLRTHLGQAVHEHCRASAGIFVGKRLEDLDCAAQIILDRGRWQDEEYVDADYADNLIRVQVPEVNPSFALFHHVNGDAFCQMDGARIPHKLLPGAPDDTFLMYGTRGQIVAGIPSLGLVVVRTGDHEESIYHKDNFIARMLGRIAESVNG